MTTVSYRSSALDENSSTVGLFAALANPERVDMTKPKRLPRSFNGLRFPSKNGELEPTEHVDPHPPLSVRSRSSTHSRQSEPGTVHSAPNQKSVFDQLTRQHMESAHSSPMKESSVHDLQTIQEEATAAYTSPVRGDRFFQDFDEDAFPSFQCPAMHTISKPASPEPAFGFRHDTTIPTETPFADRELKREEEILEKQSVLLELERLEKHHGVTLTKRYTMQDNLADMQFEIRRHLSNADEANMVKFMSDGMKLMCTGVELANSRFGPFLELDGWASSVTGDMTRYNNAFSKLYRKYWRRSTMSPEMELAFALIGSVAMHHFQRKAQGVMFGGTTKSASDSGANVQSHQGPGSMPFQSTVSQPSSSPPANQYTHDPVHTPVAPQLSEDTDEDMPPGTPETITSNAAIPESVPISARKRLVFP